MKIRHISPSSMNTYDICNYAYKLSYVYKLKGFPNSGALRGTVCHDTLEAYANSLGSNEKFNWEKFLHTRFVDIMNENKEFIQLRQDDYRKCIDDVKSVIEETEFFNNKILCTEKRCDLLIGFDGNIIDLDVTKTCEDAEIDDQDYVETFPDAFRIYCFIDIIIERDSNTIEIVDYKTGKTMKSPKNMYEDNQLLIYNYVASLLFPEYENILVSLWYLGRKHYTIAFTENDKSKIFKKLKEKWVAIKKTNNPRRTIAPYNKRWKCNFCAFKGGKEDCDKFFALEREGFDVSTLLPDIRKGKKISEITSV